MPRPNPSQPIDHERYCRADVACGLAEAEGDTPIERDGGDYGAGLIRGAAVITRGEARGHQMWIDRTMLEQVHTAIVAAGQHGVKARFTHPGLSSDGLGTFLGRFKNASDEGDVIRADLHFMDSAHNTPDGDLAGYVMDLAEEDPTAFGTSIVFRRDIDAEEQHEAEHTKNGRFESPDADNEHHFPHARLKELRAVDAVDSPAANPGGMFHRQEIGPEAEALASFALGLTDKRPSLVGLNVDPDRVSKFAKRFLERHGLAVIKKSEAPVPQTQPKTKTADAPVSKQSQTPDQPTADAADLTFARADVQRFQEAFGAQGLAWLLEGKTYEQAEKLHAEQAAAASLAEKDAALAAAQAELAEAKKAQEALQAKLASLNLGGEEEPVSFGTEEEKPVNPALNTSVGKNLARFASSLKLSGKDS